jgi:hypothetical protein
MSAFNQHDEPVQVMVGNFGAAPACANRKSR